VARQKNTEAPAHVLQRRAPLNMKASPELRARIEAAAKDNGLSLTQEVERRLIQSFNIEDQLGGGRTSIVMRSLVAAVHLAETRTGRPWLEDHVTWHAARQLILDALYQWMPAPPELPKIAVAHKKVTAAEKRMDELNAMARNLRIVEALDPATLSEDERFQHMKELSEAMAHMSEISNGMTEASDALAQARKELESAVAELDAAQLGGINIAAEILASRERR
jgi:hypothetical protein